MTKVGFAGSVLTSFLTACVTLATATTVSAEPAAVSALPQELWGQECFGPAPSKTYPGTMWYILLRVGADGKHAETWTTYGAPGSETRQSVAIKGFKNQAISFTAWDDGSYTVPVTSPRAQLILFIKPEDHQVRFSTVNRVTGSGDCIKFP